MIEHKPAYDSDSILGIVLNAADKIHEKDAKIEASLEASKRLIIELSRRTIAAEELAEECKKASLIDPLTGLDNLNSYKRISEQEFDPMRDDGHVAITYIDVDHLKLVNDSMGHDAGDVMLQATAELLQSAVRKSSNTVIRLGGDEFIILTRTHPSSIICDELSDEEIEIYDKSGQKISLKESLTIMMERILRDALAMKISFSYGIAAYDMVTDKKTPVNQKLSVWARKIEHASPLNNTLIRADTLMMAQKKSKDKKFRF